ncbi:MAG: C-GCAxxG-C-C family protein [Spirochaetia bacterium]|nr:C-GCAxxG-C-C family protein [Spirochaetia bacterium]
MKLSEIIESGLDAKEDLNCAEAMLKAANIAYNMGLDKTALKLAAGFGGGMGVESTCGALTGAIMVLSHLFVIEKAHESDYIRDLCSEFLCTFEDKMGSMECDILIKKYRDPDNNCRPIIFEASLILENIIDRELKI